MSTQSALVRKLNGFVRLSPAERHGLDRLLACPRAIARRTPLVHEGETGQRAFVLHAGWAYSYKLLPDGRQQITNFCVPGDFIGLHSVLLRACDHSSATVNGAVVSEIRTERIFRTIRQYPRLGAAVFWAVARDEAMVVEHLVDIGRRSALERLAHLVLELGERLQLVGHGTQTAFACPLTQDLLADGLGLSVVHVNRVLRAMRERRLVTFHGGQVTIHDLAALRKVAKFDNGYLDVGAEAAAQVTLSELGAGAAD